MLLLAIALPVAVHAQRAGGPPPAAREAAAIDLTGYWVSVITEDWKYRMVTPRKGVFDALPLNPEARKVGNAWDPARDEAAGEQCKAYGAAGLMRMPTRLNITWQDANTLRIQTDAGTQTRVFRFTTTGLSAASVRGADRLASAALSGRISRPDLAKADEPSWQGLSIAQWEYAPGAARMGSLKVMTTNLRPGYVRRNGAPYSERAVMTEHYDVNTLPNGERWMTITTRVEDPMYFTRPYITTSDFKQLPDAAGWNPTPCSP